MHRRFVEVPPVGSRLALPSPARSHHRRSTMTRSIRPAALDASALAGTVGSAFLSRRSLLRMGLMVGAGLAVAPTLASCASPGGSTGGAASAGVLTLALNRSLVSLDNKLNQFDAAITVQRAVRQALTKIGDDLSAELVLAESFEQTSDLQWTVKLRDDIHYSDNSPVTVEDVSTALTDYAATTGGYVGSQFPEFPTVTKIDDRTFTLDTVSPLVVLDSLMSNILITPSAANQPSELQEGVGTGPYRVESAESGSGTYTLVANENYWGPDKATIPTVNVRFIEEEASRVTALRSGEVSVIDSISADAVSQLEGVEGITIDSVDGTRYNQLFYNFRKPASSPLADPEVRRALSYAVDGDSIVTNIMGDSVTQASGVVPPALDGWAETGEFVYDPDKAKSELARLGVSDLALKFIWESGEFANDADTMEALVEMFKAVGVTVTLQQFEPGGDISAWRRGEAGDWDVLGNGYGNQTGLALTNLQGMYGATAEKEATHDSYHGFVVPEISTLISTANGTADASARDSLLAEAQQKIWDLYPCMWAFVPKAVLARRSEVENVGLRAINSYDLSAVTLSS
jgi:ABC-type transport system substrate-binding protein